MQRFQSITKVIILFSLLACGGAGNPAAGGGANGGGPGGGGSGGADCDSFGGSVADNAGVTYGCVDPAGALYEMKFDGQGGFTWVFLTTGDPSVPNGQYSVVGDQVRLVIPSFDTGGADFDETSTVTVVKLGMLAAFRTPRPACGAFRHDFDQNSLAVADYRCQPYSPGPGVTHFPVFHLGGLEGTQNSPLLGQDQPGNAFWSTQKDIAGSISNQDYYGIYRQQGDQVCMYFPAAPAGQQEVQAELSTNLETLNVDRPELQGSGPCGRI